MTIHNPLKQLKNALYSVKSEDSHQKDYLIMLEKACKVNKPIFIDRNVEHWQAVKKQTGIDIWAIDDAKMAQASLIAENNIVGRYRVDGSNSDSIYEMWFELDCNRDLKTKEDVKAEWNTIAKAGKKLLYALNSFGVDNDFIQIKSSGRGLHFSVFCSGFRDDKQYANAMLYIQKQSGLSLNIKQSESKGVVFGFDSPAIASSRRKIRELGGQNDKLSGMTHYVSLLSNLDGKSYPFVTKAKDVVYPSEIKIFEVTKDFINKMHEFETSIDTKDSVQDTGEVVYERDGEITKLHECPLIAKIAQDAQNKVHITNPQRIFLSQTFTFFGEAGEREVHRILAFDDDYSEGYTQNQLENVKKNNRKPITCKWARDKDLCPTECNGLTFKSPVGLAWKKPTFQDLKQKILNHVKLHPGHEDVIDFLLAMMIERYYPYGKPVWVFLIAASGGGKSKLLQLFTGWNLTYYISEVKKKDLISGYKEIGDSDDVKYGILEDFDGKTAIIDDMSQILSGDKEERNAVFGTFRLIFDGEEHKGYGNRKGKLTYKANFGMIMGMTPIIDVYYGLMNQLGERFIKVRFKTKRDDALHSIFTRNDKDYDTETIKIRNKIVEFLSSIEHKDYDPPLQYEQLITNLCEFTARMRTPLIVQGEGDDIKGTPEEPTRVMIQIVKLCKMLACVRGKDEITEEEIDFVGKTLMQTPPLWRIQAFYYLLCNPDCTINALADALFIRHEKASRILDELYFLRICHKDENTSTYNLSPKFIKWGKTFEQRGWFKWLKDFSEEFDEFRSNNADCPPKRKERGLDGDWLQDKTKDTTN
ncbi:MAG: hypothetical protein WC365_06755 [Candidatus Babeliales bacterium]|jgi:hypothetical protein